MMKNYFSLAEAQKIGKQIGLDWRAFDPKQFCMGLNIELQRGWVDPYTHVTKGDPISTARLVLSKLREIPDYYTRLGRMLDEAGREYGPRLFAATRKTRQIIQ